MISAIVSAILGLMAAFGFIDPSIVTSPITIFQSDDGGSGK